MEKINNTLDELNDQSATAECSISSITLNKSLNKGNKYFYCHDKKAYSSPASDCFTVSNI